MKAISLWQPHASFVARGLKGVETRHWPTAYRGPLLIHAARRWTRDERDTLRRLYNEFAEVAEEIAVDVTPPLGAVVAVARLVDCRLMTPEWIDAQTPLERAVGGWCPERYGWVLEDVRPVDPTIPLRGRQGLFEVRLGRDLRVADAERIARLLKQA